MMKAMMSKRDELSFKDMRPEERMIIQALERAFASGQHEMRIAELQIANGWDEVDDHECPEDGICPMCAEALRKGNSKVRNNLRRLMKYGWIHRPLDGAYALSKEPEVEAPQVQLVQIRRRDAEPNPRALTKEECKTLRARVMSGDMKAMDAVKRTDCAFYSTCIDQALSGKWPGFTCSACTAYATPDYHQQMSDMLALRAMDKASEMVHEFGKVLRVRGVKPGTEFKRTTDEATEDFAEVA